MKSFTVPKIPEWVKTISKKYDLMDDEFFAICQAVDEVEYLHSLNLDGDARHDRQMEVLQKKAKELEKFGSGDCDYRWPKSVATIRYELRAVIPNNKVYNEVMDRLLAMKKVPRESDLGMIKARKDDIQNWMYMLKWSASRPRLSSLHPVLNRLLLEKDREWIKTHYKDEF